LYSGQQPSFTFAPISNGSNYGSPFPDPITYIAADTNFTLNNTSGETVTISGNINSGSTTGSILTVNNQNTSTTSTISFTGNITVPTLTIEGTGETHIYPSTGTNSIETINLNQSTLLINSTASLGGVTAFNVDSGSTSSTLGTAAGGDYTAGFSFPINFQGIFLLENYTGTNVTFSGNITGSNSDDLQVYTPGGSTYLTGALTTTTLNPDGGNLYLQPATGTNSIGAISIDIENTNLYINSNRSLAGVTNFTIGNNPCSLNLNPNADGENFSLNFPIVYATPSVFTITNSSGFDASISGNIAGSDTTTLVIDNTGNNTVTLAGNIGTNTMISNGSSTSQLILSGSNSISQLQLNNTNLHVTSDGSLSGVAAMTLTPPNASSLSFDSGITGSVAFPASITTSADGANFTIINNTGVTNYLISLTGPITLPGNSLTASQGETSVLGMQFTASVVVDTLINNTILTLGGSNTINTINLNDNSSLFINSNNSLGGATAVNPTGSSQIIFDSGSYTPFDFSITYQADGTTFNVNNSIPGGDITLNGDITASTFTGSSLSVNSTAPNAVSLKGNITVGTVSIAGTGETYIEPSTGTNSIGTINLYATALIIDSTASLGGVTAFNVDSGSTSSTLQTAAGGDYTAGFSFPINFQGIFLLENYTGTDVTFSGNITGSNSDQIQVYSGGSTTYLTGALTTSLVSPNGGNLYLQPATGLVNSIGTVAINVENTNLYINSNRSLGGVSQFNIGQTPCSLILETNVDGDAFNLNFPISYTYRTPVFTITNNDTLEASLPGAITGTAGSLELYAGSGGLSLTGAVSLTTLGINSGSVSLEPLGVSNDIATVNVTNATLIIDSNESFGTGPTTINLGDTSVLALNNNFNTTPLSSNFTIALNPVASTGCPTRINDNGHYATINSFITGVGTYCKLGGGLQVLTNTSNDYEGSTLINQGTLSIPSIDVLGTGGATPFLQMQNGAGLYVSADVTISSLYPIAIQPGGGSLSAAAGASLTVDSPITKATDGVPLQIGNSSGQVSNPTGSVTFINTGNDFSGQNISVGGMFGGTEYPVNFSAEVSTLGGLGTLILQYGSTYYPGITSALPFAITIGDSSGNLNVPSGVTLTVNGAISSSSNTATLNLNGGGTFILAADNSAFTGNLVVDSSTLQINSAVNLGSATSFGLQSATLAIGGDITASQPLSITGSSAINTGIYNASFASVISNGAATLTKQGSGTLSILPTTGSNIANLTVSDGTFIGNTNSLNTSAISLDAFTTVEFSQSSAGTFTGSISGAGSVSVDGSAPLTFNPTSSTYTGGTSLFSQINISKDNLGDSSSLLMMEDGGILNSTSTFTLSRYITLLGNTTFSQDSGTTLTVTGTLAGSGSLNKNGSGTLILLEDSPDYSGIISANEGTLIVNGNLSGSGDPIIQSGALLAGTGIVGDTQVFGTIEGGDPTSNPLGTLTINGDLILEPGSYFVTTVSSPTGSLVDASGDVTISTNNTTYDVVLQTGSFYPATFPVLQGSSITGTFSQISSGGSTSAYFFDTSLTYTPTEVRLKIVPADIASIIAAHKASGGRAAGQNAINVAEALSSAIYFNRTQVKFSVTPGGITATPSPELPKVLLSLLPFINNPERMTYALNQLHPAQVKGMAIAQESNIVQVQEALHQRLQSELDLMNCTSCTRTKKTITPWISGIGESLGQDTETNSWGPLTGYRSNMGGFGAGIDGRFAKNFYTGVLTGYTNSHIRWKNDQGTGNTSTGYAGLYLSGIGEMFYGNASVIGSWSNYTTDRNIIYGLVNKTAKNSHGGSQILSHLDTGINWNCLDLTIRPFDSVDYISQVENSYTEYNADEWNLHVENNNEIMIRNELGLQLAKCFCFWGSKLTISPKLSWIYESRPKGANFITNFVGGGSSFLIEGYFPDRSLFAPGVVVTGVMLQDSLAFNLYYNGEFGSGYRNSTYGGQVRYAF
jgi:autotransporter-associated beta strand protein